MEQEHRAELAAWDAQFLKETGIDLRPKPITTVGNFNEVLMPGLQALFQQSQSAAGLQNAADLQNASGLFPQDQRQLQNMMGMQDMRQQRNQMREEMRLIQQLIGHRKQ